MLILKVIDVENCSLNDILDNFSRPIIIVNSRVGRGNISVGEAIEEKLADEPEIYHFHIEDFLPKKSVNEDFIRYRFISNKLPFLLYLMYKIPFFYYRKYLWERLSPTSLKDLKEKVKGLKPKTVICVSHRPTFWMSNLKKQHNLDFNIWCVMTEFGDNLGYRYLFWNSVDGFISPIERQKLSINFPNNILFNKTQLPVKIQYSELSKTEGDSHKILITCGSWGQGPILKTVKSISEKFPHHFVYVVCGDNKKLFEKLKTTYKDKPNIYVYGLVDSLLSFLKDCSIIITKPGISTLLEAYTAKRKIFLIKGLPVSEDNNAIYAIKYFNAEWFTIENVNNWFKKIKKNE